MKLESFLTISLTLAITAALPAQFDAVDTERDLGISSAIDTTGVDIAVQGGYRNGTTVLLYSFETGSTLIPEEAGGGEITLGPDMQILTIGQNQGDGTFHAALPFDTAALANAGISVYVQAVSINSPDWTDVPGETTNGGLNPVWVSGRLEINFYSELREYLNQEIENQPSVGGPEGNAPDGDNGTDAQVDCRCQPIDHTRGNGIR